MTAHQPSDDCAGLAPGEETAGGPVTFPGSCTPSPAHSGPVARISLGTIAKRLGFKVSSELLERLGLPAERERAACMYPETDWPLIKTALIEHIKGLD